MKTGVLKIGTTGTETPFLPESELPECARLSVQGQGSQELEDRDLAEAMSRSSQEVPRGPRRGGGVSRLDEFFTRKVEKFLGFTVVHFTLCLG